LEKLKPQIGRQTRFHKACLTQAQNRWRKRLEIGQRVGRNTCSRS